VGRLTALEIYEVAREAGFAPHQAVTWTAIALAESGGQPDAHAGHGEDSWGLWQINVAHGVRGNRWGNLENPVINARAAFELSNHGTDMSPWTTTHDSRRGTASDYRRYRAEAEAGAHGISGEWGGVRGYGDHGSARTLVSDGVLPQTASFDQVDAGAGVSAPVDSDADGLTDDFERVAGTDPHQADSDHDGLSDGFEGLRSHTDPLSADTDHDGSSDAVEWARGSDAGHLAGVAGVAGSGSLRQSVRHGVADFDHDGLSDRFEALIGTDPHRADSDGDGLSDALERALGTNPMSVDSDSDGLSDGLETRAGTVAAAPNAEPAVGLPAGSAATGLTGALPNAHTTADPVPAASGKVQDFLQAALSQRGDPYIWGANASFSDPNPRGFDCSELVRWAAHRGGVTLPDGSWQQYLALQRQGAVIPVEQAIHTPGALLFRFSSTPRPGGGRPGEAHVAISLGNGKTIEARGRAYGVNEFSAEHRFTYAAVIPDLHGDAVGSHQASFDQVDAGAAVSAPVDSDADGLTDDFERVAGTDPHQADSDHDGLSDGFEGLRSHTDPLSADTDHDGSSDAVEWARGSDAGHLAGVAGVAGSGSLRQSVRHGVADSDHDGLSDRFEALIGTDPHRADSDGDGLSDALERALGTNPMSVDSDSDGLSDGLETRAGGDPLHALGADSSGPALGPDGGSIETAGHDVAGHDPGSAIGLH
jgi:cell wall-associated NlpC family hydrolase